MRTSKAGVDLIKTFEGFRDRSQRLPDGGWVIGYGHTRSAREGFQITEAEAEAILREFDLPPIESAIGDLILAPLNQNEFDALVSLAFNIGLDSFADSDVLEQINSGNRLAAAAAIDAWRKAKVGARTTVVDALVRRRAAEKSLFLTGPEGAIVASSSRFRPRADTAIRFAMGPIQAPYEPEEPAPIKDAVVEDHIDPVEPEERSVSESATEAAARTVGARLTRILGEAEPVKGEAEELFSDGDDEAEPVAEVEPATAVAAVHEASPANDMVAPIGSDEQTFEIPDDLDADEIDLAENDNIETPVEMPTEDEDDEASSVDEITAAISAISTGLEETVDVETEETELDNLVASSESESGTPYAPFGTDPAPLLSQDDVSDAVVSMTHANKDLEEVEDDGPVELSEFSTTLTAPTEEPLSNGNGQSRVIIDDFAPEVVEEPTNGKKTKVKKPKRLSGGYFEPMAFLLLTLAGAGVAAYGAADYMGIMETGEPMSGPLAPYFPHFMMLFGGLLFVVMAYYAFRALISYNR